MNGSRFSRPELTGLGDLDERATEKSGRVKRVSVYKGADPAANSEIPDTTFGLEGPYGSAFDSPKGRRPHVR